MRGLDRIGWPWLGRYEPIPSLAGFRPVIGDRGMVSSPHATASTIGLGVLQSGGNAVDAAIATSAALAVTCPMQCGPGGDAFWLVSAPDGKLSALDASGRCPSRADAARLRADGFATIGPRSPYSVTVPGAVSGWTKAHDAFGSKTLAELIEPAAALAERGVFVSRHILTSFLTAQSELVAKGALHLWSADDRVPELYSRMKQVRLAAALRSIAASGGRALYDGHLAEAIVRAVQNVGGWLGADDLAGHQADWIAPISGRFRELTVFTTPPSTQGFSLLAALAFVEGAAPSKLDPFDPDTVHLMIEAVAAALADRDSNNGDRDCLAAAVNSLWSTARVDAFVQQFSSRRCNVPSPVTRRVTKGDTAHLAVLDRNGMAVSLIQSLFFDFGSCIPVPEGGFTLQNRGAAFHLEDGEPGALQASTRPPSTLIPTIALQDGRPRLVLGCMGGDGQVQTQLQLLVDLCDGGLDPQQAVSRPRWYLDRAETGQAVFLEAGISPEVAKELETRGHRVERLNSSEDIMGHAQVIRRERSGALTGAADPRSDGQVAAF